MSRVLILTPRFPYPVIGGDRLRIHYLCRELARQHRLTLLSLCASREEMNADYDTSVFAEVHRIHLSPLRSLIQTLLAIPTNIPLQLAWYRCPDFAKQTNELCSRHDLAIAHLIRTGQYLVGNRTLPRVLEMTDAISMNYNRLRQISGRTLGARIMSFEASRLLLAERRMAKQFELTSLVSPVDRDYLASGGSGGNWIIAPNGVDLERISPIGSTQSSVIAFIGNMASVQNQDACWHFIRNVLPLVCEQLPQARFRVIGRGPKRILDRLNRETNVEATGEVLSVMEATRGSLCGVCPIRAGAGMQNKILEYLALGLPAITSPIGLEGIPALPGHDLLVAEAPGIMANLVVDLFRSPQLRDRLSANGIQFVREHMSWSNNLSAFSSWIADTLDRATGPMSELKASVRAGETTPALVTMTTGQTVVALH